MRLKRDSAAGIRLAVRAHDIPSPDAESLCKALHEMGIQDIQLVPHKSFPGFQYTDEAIAELAAVLRKHQVRVAVYGCYIDPASAEGEKRFLSHIRFAAMLGAGLIATETGISTTVNALSEESYSHLVQVFQEFVCAAREQGVIVAVEAVAVHPIATPEQMRRLLDDVPELTAVFDPENLRLNMKTKEDPAERALLLYSGLIRAVHWKRKSVDADTFVLDWLKEHPEIPLVAEGLMRQDLRRLLNELRDSVQ